MEEKKKPVYFSHKPYATHLGTFLRFVIMTVILFVMAGYTYRLFQTTQLREHGVSIMVVALITGVVFAACITFKKKWGALFGPLFPFFQGIFLGGLAFSATHQSPGIVIRVVLVNYLIMLLMLALYYFNVVDTGEKFKKFVKYTTLTVIGYYLFAMLFYFAFDYDISFVRSREPYAKVIGAIICLIVSLTYLVDFDLIHKFCHLRANRYMQWYGSFICMISFVWLCIELYHLFVRL